MGEPNWKPLPHKVTKRKQQRGDKVADDKARKEVRAHWRYRCRVCNRRTSVVHENKRRGAGGPVNLQNSFLACDLDDGGICHVLLQRRFIEPVMVNGAEEFDAREELMFEMTEKVAELVFEKRPRPPHVRIVEG